MKVTVTFEKDYGERLVPRSVFNAFVNELPKAMEAAPSTSYWKLSDFQITGLVVEEK